jgi:hypothetical protein
MKFIVFIFALAIASTSFAQTNYHLTDKQPVDSKYACITKAAFSQTGTGYSFVSLPGFQTYENPGVYFSNLNKGKVCYHNEDTHGYRCITAEGTVDPIVLTRKYCTSLLPVPCSTPQIQDVLVQNGNSLVQIHQEAMGQTVCTYSQE